MLKFLPRLVKKIFFAHPDHDEEKDTIKRIKGQKSACRQEETRRGRQEEIDFLGEDEDYRGQGKATSAKVLPAKTPKTKSKAVASKSSKVEKTVPKRRPHRSMSSEEGESKVREIASQTKPEPSEDKGKGDEGGFSLSASVRSCLTEAKKNKQPLESRSCCEGEGSCRQGFQDLKSQGFQSQKNPNRFH